MEIFLTAEAWIALLTLTLLEIVLGVDNIIFISIVANRLPKEDRKKARNTGLILALVIRIILLLGITWIIHSTQPLFTLFSHDVSLRDLILMLGGLFLIAKSTTEVHHKMEGAAEKTSNSVNMKSALNKVIFQIVILDIVFSFDSILTAVGLVSADMVLVMILAVVISMGIMLIFSGKIAEFISTHPTLEILALSFLILIGFTLVLEGLHVPVPKGYIYFAVFFSFVVELLNMRLRKKGHPVKLNQMLEE